MITIYDKLILLNYLICKHLPCLELVKILNQQTEASWIIWYFWLTKKVFKVIKDIVHPKNIVLSWFTQSCVIPNLLWSIDCHCIDKKHCNIFQIISLSIFFICCFVQISAVRELSHFHAFPRKSKNGHSHVFVPKHIALLNGAGLFWRA